MKRSLIVLMLLAGTLAGYAQNYKTHSLYIFTFSRYVKWPEPYNQGDFEIFVLGETPMTEELKSMAQVKKVGDRPIRVTQISSPAEIRKCNILFVPAAMSALLPEVLAKVGSQPILVITEEAGLGTKGSNINLVPRDDGKPAFELNQNAMTRQNLKVSNELTRLAILI